MTFSFLDNFARLLTACTSTQCSAPEFLINYLLAWIASQYLVPQNQDEALLCREADDAREDRSEKEDIKIQNAQRPAATLVTSQQPASHQQSKQGQQKGGHPAWTSVLVSNARLDKKLQSWQLQHDFL